MSLQEAARPLLRNEEKLHLRRETLEEPPRRRKKRRGATRAGGQGAADRSGRSLDDEAQRLYKALSAYRMQLAKAQSLPSYCIFTNATLVEMAQRRPATLADLRTVSGVGDAKLSKYGEGFLRVLRGFGARDVPDARERWAQA